VTDGPNAIGNTISNVNAAAQAIAERRKKTEKARIVIIPAGLPAERTHPGLPRFLTLLVVGVWNCPLRASDFDGHRRSSNALKLELELWKH